MTKLNSKIAKAGLGLVAGASMLLGAASAMAYTYNVNLKVGSRGADVTALQTMLGVTPATGYFGNLTKAAVTAWQASHNLPATGYFGPMSRTVANATGGTTTGGLVPGCTGTTGFSPTTGQPCGTGTTPTPTGNAMPGKVQAMAGTMAASMYLPTGAENVKVGEFVVTAPSDMSTTVSTMTFKRTGVGTVSEISAAYLYDGATRLTSGRTFNSSTNELTFTVNSTLAQGTSKTYSLYVSVTGSTAGSHTFTLTGMTVTAGTVVMPAMGVATNMHSISSVSSGTLTLTKTGSISNPKVGDKMAQVSEFTLAAGSAEDVNVTNVALTTGGSVANSSLTNFVLKQNGNTVGTASGIDAKGRVNIAFTSPFRIEKGNSRIFQLYADVTGRPSDTIIFYMEDSADLMGMGGTYGMGVDTTVTAMDTTGEAHTLTLQGGQFTITWSGPASQNISNNASDKVIWSGTVYSANTVEVRNWRFQLADQTSAGAGLCESSSSCHVQDIKLWNLDNNTVIAGPVELTPAANLGEVSATSVTFTDDYTINAGTSMKIGLSVDIKETPASGVLKILATMGDGTNSFTANDLKNVDSNTFLSLSTDVTPSTTIAGQPQTVTAGALTVNTSASPSDNTIVKGVANASVTAFDFVVGSGDSVKVNTIVVTAGTSDANDNEYGASGASDTDTGNSVTVSSLILSAKLMVDGAQVGTNKTFTSGTATFDNLNWTIPASSTKKVTVVVSTNSAATLGNSDADYLRLSIETSGVTAVDSNGNTVSASGLAVNSAEGAGDTVVTIATAGDLIASLSGTTASAGIVSAGTTGRSLATFKFEATNEAFNVKKFNLMPMVAGSSSAASNDRLGGVTVKYQTEAQRGTSSYTLTSVGISGTSNTVDISAAPLYVPKNDSAYVEVIGDFASFDTNDGTEQENIAFTLDADDTAVVAEASGVGSNTSDVTWASSDINGNRVNVYRSVLTVAKNTAAGVEISTTKARSSSQVVASYNFSASNSAGARFRGSLRAVDGATTGWTGTGTGASATSSTAVSGSSSVSHTEDAASAVADHFHYDFGASAGLENYDRMSFWIRSSAAKASGDLGVYMSSTADTSDNAAFSVTSQYSSTTAIGALTASTWTFVDIDLSSITSSTRYFSINVEANPDNNAVILVDDLRLYNDSMQLTVAGSLNSTLTTSNGLLFTMKDSGGTTKMYGAYTGTAATGTVTLIPGNGSDITTQAVTADLDVTTTAAAYDVYASTTSLMATDTTAAESLGVTVTTGTPSSAGSFRWYDNGDTAGSNNMAGITVLAPVSTTIDFSNNY